VRKSTLKKPSFDQRSLLTNFLKKILLLQSTHLLTALEGALKADVTMLGILVIFQTCDSRKGAVTAVALQVSAYVLGPLDRRLLLQVGRRNGGDGRRRFSPFSGRFPLLGCGWRRSVQKLHV
jgi:hypothetical protein